MIFDFESKKIFISYYRIPYQKLLFGILHLTSGLWF